MSTEFDDLEEKKTEDEYEDVCFMCRRPEHIAGKMFKMPQNICICNDCMQKTMDMMSQYDYQGMLNQPGMMMTPEDFNSFQKQLTVCSLSEPLHNNAIFLLTESI